MRPPQILCLQKRPFVCLLLISCITFMSLLLSSCEPIKLESSAQFLSDTGEKVDFPSKKGKFIVLNFWASWCTPCRQEVPDFNQLHKQYPQLKIIGFNIDHLDAKQLEWATQKLDIQYPNLLNDPREALNLPSLPGIPTTYILSPQGEWFGPLVGAQSADKILDVVKHASK